MSVKIDILKALKGEKPQRVPWNIHHLLLPRGTLERELRNRGLGIIDKGVHPYGTSSKVISVETRQSYRNGRWATSTTHHTPAGELHGEKIVGPDGSIWVEEYLVKGPQDLKILKAIAENTEYFPNDEEVLSHQKNLGEDGLVLCRMMRSPLQRLFIEWMGTEGTIYALADYPQEMESLLECMADSDAAAFPIAARSPAEALWSAENITSALTNPVLFTRYCLPYYERLASLARANGKPYGIHMDGMLSSLKEAIAASGLDFIEGFTPPPMGDLELESARDAWPTKALWTNFPGSVLHRSDEEVIAYTVSLLSWGMKAGRFLLTLAEDFPDPERSLGLIAEGVARYEQG